MSAGGVITARSGFEEVEHTADWALRVWGSDLRELLIQAAQGMLALLGAQPAPGPRNTRTFEVEAPDRESLLVSWLEELLYHMETRHVTFTDIDLEVDGETRLRARVTEAPLADLRKHIKAVTYHNLSIQETPNGLEATVVFDV